MAASNITMAVAATDAVLGAAAATTQSPAIRLLHTLIATFAAIFIGFVTVRLQLVVPGRGDMAAMGFYTGKIALPLLIFKTVATTSLGSVDPGTIAACTLGKLTVMVLTFIATYFAYNTKQKPSHGQRMLTSGIFSFFVVASNDFALGLPVVQALYGKQLDMAAYVSANALVGSVLFTPAASIMFAVGGASKKDDKEGGHEQEAQEVDDGSHGSACCTGCLATALDILRNPVIVSTILGALYKLALGGTLVENDGKLDFPSPLTEIMTLFTSPFGMSALFLTGTNLRSAELTIWPLFLVLMKVLACAYASFLFGGLLVGNVTPSSLKDVLVNFTFFYGSVPTSSSPLLFAAQYDPGAVELVASAILFGLILAGPIMFTTALFLESDGTDLMHVLRQVQLTASVASAGAMLVFAALVLCLGPSWGWRCAGKQIVAAYGLVLLVYSSIMIAFNPRLDPALCRQYDADRFFPLAVAVTWLQSAARLLLLSLMGLLVTVWASRGRVPSWTGPAVVAACLALGAVPAMLIYPNTLNEVCSGFMKTELQHGTLVRNFIDSCALLVAVVALAVVGMFRLRSSARAATRDDVGSSSGSDSELDSGESHSEEGALNAKADGEHDHDWASTPPKGIVRTLGVVLALRALTQVVDTVEVISSRIIRGSFTQMLVLESLMEHGQGVILLVVLFFDPKFIAALSPKISELLEMPQRCLRKGTSILHRHY